MGQVVQTPFCSQLQILPLKALLVPWLKINYEGSVSKHEEPSSIPSIHTKENETNQPTSRPAYSSAGIVIPALGGRERLKPMLGAQLL